MNSRKALSILYPVLSQLIYLLRVQVFNRYQCKPSHLPLLLVVTVYKLVHPSACIPEPSSRSTSGTQTHSSPFTPPARTVQTPTPTTPKASHWRLGRRSASLAHLRSARTRRRNLALREAEYQYISHDGSETPDADAAVSTYA